MKSLNKTILATGAAVITLAAVASPASAALITAWDWSVTTQFAGATWEEGPTPVAGTTFAGAATGSEGVYQDASTISWGGNTDFSIGGNVEKRSALTLDLPNTVTSPPNPPVITNGPLSAPTSQMSHWNNPIDNDLDFLNNATLTSSLTLTPNTPAGPGFTLPTINFGINFKETNNGGPCPVGSTPCPDIFVISPSTPFGQEFTIGQITYAITIRSQGASVVDLSNAACLAAGAVLGCRGFTTAESARSTVQFGFEISQVPEPGTLSLMGIGLVGGAVLRRRKRVA